MAGLESRASTNRQASRAGAAAVAGTLEELARALAGRRVVALTGAGCSTESGIPDYRGPRADGRPRAPRASIQGPAFVSSDEVRRRYWARAILGWPAIAEARPNPAHLALASLEARGALAGVLTQNVDGLHGAAGSRQLIELHGALSRVRCLGCGALTPRSELQDRLLSANPGWPARHAELAPDGDAELDAELVAGFVVVPCRPCGGPLKPDVVFFGENVPPRRLAAAWALFERADVLLVVGSSLQVYSGFRFVRRASERGLPVVIVNRGSTRGDALATLRVDARAGAILPMLVERLDA